MPSKIKLSQATALIDVAKHTTTHDFIIEICTSRKKSHAPRIGFRVRIKGLNGEIVLAGEHLEHKRSARLLVASFLKSGLQAKVKDLTE